MDKLTSKVDRMCMNGQTGMIFESDGVSEDWLNVWRNLEIADAWKNNAPYYNLYIWNLAEEKIRIWLETSESASHKTILPGAEYDFDSDGEDTTMQGTIWKYST